MGAVNRKLQRWVVASISKHLHAAAAEVNLPLVVEFLDTRSDDFKNAARKAEVTISGPSIRELSPGFLRAQASVFIIVTSIPGMDTNAWNHMDDVGRLQEALSECVLVKKYDVGIVSPDEVGVMEPRTDQPVSVAVTHLKPGVPDQLQHSVIEALYIGYFQ